MKKDYENIIAIPHPVSVRHSQMTQSDRAAQFAPFAALTGHDEALAETARLTDKKIELDENEKDLLDKKLVLLQERLSEQPAVRVTYFIPDEKKTGGKYVTVDRRIKKTDNIYRKMIFTDGTQICADDILNLEIEGKDYEK